MIDAARVAVLFAGQGSEEARMGLALRARDGAARALLDEASACAGLALERALASGAALALRTGALQPALVAAQLGLYQWLAARGLRAGSFAGHSLGELSAAAAAGALDHAAAVRVASARGAAMERCAVAHPGGMYAATGLDEARAAALLAELEAARDEPRALWLAAHNAPDERVLSGAHEALARVARRYAGARLPVSGPWHSGWMAPAGEALEAALAREASHAVPRVEGFVAGVDGAPREAVPEVRRALVDAVAAPVRWVAALRSLEARGVEVFVLVGPARALRGTLRRTLAHGGAARVLLADEPEAAEATLRALESGL